MQLLTYCFSIALLVKAAFASPVPDDLPLDSAFLSDTSLVGGDALDTSSSTPLDPSFSDLTSPPLEIDWSTDSSATPLENNALSADSSNTPLETFDFQDPSGALLASSCGAGSEPFSKRDGEICVPGDAGEAPLPLLDLPDLNDVENALGADRKLPRRMRQYLIPPIPGYTTEDDPQCPRPKRRLCCAGPLSHSMMWVWQVVYECRGIEKKHLPGDFPFRSP